MDANQINVHLHSLRDGQGATFEKKMTRDDFIKSLFEWLTVRFLKFEQTFYGSAATDEEVHRIELEAEYHYTHFPKFNLKDYSQYEGPDPRIRAWMGRETVAAEIVGLGWVFGTRLADEPYQEVQIPKELELHQHTGDICGHGVYFPAHKFPWPRPICTPGWPLDEEMGKHYFTLLETKELLEELAYQADENPITILCRSPQPYKGLGYQLAKRVETIHQKIRNSLR